MKKKLKIVFVAVLIYLLLLSALVAVESPAEGATITNIWDAIWYSIVTLTTVGYGDVSPVTPAGRTLGVIFALCSIGVLSALISLILSMIGSQFMPRLRLQSMRSKDWYVFSGKSQDAITLAKELREKHPDAASVFLTEDSQDSLFNEKPEGFEGSILLRASVQEIMKLRGETTGKGVFLLFMDESEWDNLAGMTQAAELFSDYPELEIYCMAQSGADPLKGMPLSVHLFSREECVSRCYWKDHPLKDSEHCVVLLGCGKAGAELLSRALMINVFDRDRKVEYHVFEDTSGFEQTHPEIMKAIGREEPETASELSADTCTDDTLTFYDGNWQARRELIERADRIILCADDEEENLKKYVALHKWYVTAEEMHVYLPSKVASIPNFGNVSEVITEEFVMKDALNRQAVMLNEIYSEGTKTGVSFAELSDFARQSNIAAADHMPVKIRWLLKDESIKSAGPQECRRAYEVFCSADAEEKDRMQEMEHRRWMRFHQLYNWKYSPARNIGKRCHPLLVPYEELSAADKAKDGYAWELLGRFGQE